MLTGMDPAYLEQLDADGLATVVELADELRDQRPRQVQL